jgi:hypothetical protein
VQTVAIAEVALWRTYAIIVEREFLLVVIEDRVELGQAARSLHPIHANNALAVGCVLLGKIVDVRRWRGIEPHAAAPPVPAMLGAELLQSGKELDVRVQVLADLLRASVRGVDDTLPRERSPCRKSDRSAAATIKNRHRITSRLRS